MLKRRDILGVSAGLAAASLLGSGQRAGAGEGGAGVSARAAGFGIPLEAGPHARTFMQWPMRPSLYGGRRALEVVRTSVALIANTIAAFEPVALLGPAGEGARIADATTGRVEHRPLATDDLWCRDSGPTFLRAADGRLAVSDLNFNGWGNRQAHRDDRAIAAAVARSLGLPVFDNGLIGEGGGVETDGAGTAMAHESSWINPNRNRMAKAAVERLLLDALGAEKMIWAPGIAGADITDYHIDALARFVRPGLVVVQLPDRVFPGDPWSAAAFETYEALRAATDARGEKLEVVVIPDPVDIRSGADDFVASYVNYYVCNGAVIAGEFGDDRADAAAESTLAALYPGREVVMLNVDPIAEAGGGVHCTTQQQPVTGA